MKWRTVRIFISSTFNDMHAERDFLVKYVFPELSTWCRERRINLIDIDLRWGVSLEDSTAKNTVLACLSNIDESRPFFLCFLGQRRGWIPKLEDVSGNTYNNYPNILNCVGSKSVTEMEIEHALLNPMLRLIEEKSVIPPPVNHALFFFRNNPFSHVLLSDVQRNIYTNGAAEDPFIADELLTNLKKKIKGKWNVCEYDCRWDSEAVSLELKTEGNDASKGRLADFSVNGQPLKDVIIKKLKKEIESEFPENYPVTALNPLEKDMKQQEQFIIQCAEVFIHREKDIEELIDYIESESRKPFILVAEAGLGKTTLLANFILLSEQNHKSISARFCGAFDMASSQLGLWKSIFLEQGISFQEDLEEIKRNIYLLLSQIQGTLIIDGIDQLQSGTDILSWLPHELPNGLKLIVSLKEDRNSKPRIQAASQFSVIHRIKPFSYKEDKMSLINEYLKRYLKHLDDHHMEIICDTKGSDNPLFLKIVLYNLRVFGAYKQLESEIKKYGEDPISAFNAVLAGLEEDTSYITVLPGQSFVPLLFGLLSKARLGLTEDELTYCLKIEYPVENEESIRCALRIYLRRMRPFIANREGRIDFLYDSFREAAVLRYQENRLHDHKLLVSCFLSICDPQDNGEFSSKEPRALTELAYHLFQLDVSLGKALLCNILYINARCSACGSGELISDFLMILEPGSQTEFIKNFLIRFSDVFSKYKNSFFSTALIINYKKAWDLLSSPVKPKSYILPERIPLQKYGHESSSDHGFRLEVKASLKLDKTVTVCIPKNASFAIFSEGVGRLRIIYLSTMLVDEKVIAANPKRPMDIFASDNGSRIVVTYDDETAEVIDLDFEEGVFVASQKVIAIDYYIPMFSDGIFAFFYDSLWYQKDKSTVVKLCKEEETKFLLPEEGDVSALIIDENIGILGLRTMNGSKLCQITEVGVQTVLEYFGCDIICIAALGSGDMAVSLSDATIRLINNLWEEKGHVNTGISCALLLESEKGLLCITERRYKVYLWDMQDSLKECECIELTYNKKIAASYYDGVIRIISDQYVLIASIIENALYSATLLTILFHDDELILVFRNNSKEISVQLGNKTAKILWDSEKLTFLKIHNELLIFDTLGNMAVVDLVNMTVRKGMAEFRMVSVAAAKESYYGIDTAGFLHLYPKAVNLPSISEYMLSSASLRIYDDLMILTGISTNARAGKNSTPYIMIILKVCVDGSLRIIGERYFPKDKGMFIGSCFCQTKRKLYVFFSTPHSGSSDTHPTVSYGTMDEFISFGEKQADLYFDRKNNGFFVSNNTLFICGGGIISAYEADSIRYLSSITSEGGFHMPIQKNKDSLYAIDGSNHVFKLTSINTH